MVTLELASAVLLAGTPAQNVATGSGISTATLTREDENLLENVHDTARRLDERLATIERIMDADNPNWKSGL